MDFSGPREHQVFTVGIRPNKISLPCSSRGGAKCMRGPSGRGASRLARASVLSRKQRRGSNPARPRAQHAARCVTSLRKHSVQRRSRDCEEAGIAGAARGGVSLVSHAHGYRSAGRGMRQVFRAKRRGRAGSHPRLCSDDQWMFIVGTCLLPSQFRVRGGGLPGREGGGGCVGRRVRRG